MTPLDPNRPHALGDVIDRIRSEGPEHWHPSEADIIRARAYVSDEIWDDARLTTGRTDYDLARTILLHLELHVVAHERIAHHTAVACDPCKAAIGVPCGYAPDSGFMLSPALVLPEQPLFCLWRELAALGRLPALDLFIPVGQEQYGRAHLALQATAAVAGDGDVVIARVQHLDLRPLTADRIFISFAKHWRIRDVRFNGVSGLDPHFDLPGALVARHRMRFPVIGQGHWIEIEALCVHAHAPAFDAHIFGTYA